MGERRTGDERSSRSESIEDDLRPFDPMIFCDKITARASNNLFSKYTTACFQRYQVRRYHFPKKSPTRRKRVWQHGIGENRTSSLDRILILSTNRSIVESREKERPTSSLALLSHDRLDPRDYSDYHCKCTPVVSNIRSTSILRSIVKLWFSH